MNLTAIARVFVRRVGTRNHGVVFANGEPGGIHVGGTPRDYSVLQHAIGAIKEVEPKSDIDLEPALKYLRNK